MHTDALKVRIGKTVEALAPTLAAVSREIHANPELGFQEFKAVATLCEALERHGVRVSRHAYGLDTSFVAEIGRSGPCVALISEYDALPDVGHACGHNIIAATGLGAALSLAALQDDLPGKVRYLGTPAEEGGGGKELMARRGAFGDVDCAMMVHPSTEDLAAYPLIANARASVHFHGRSAHASSSPEAGLNALDALVTAYQSIGALRQHLPPGHRVHGIITNGGKAANVVPELAEGLFVARAPDLKMLNGLRARLDACFKAGALATGTTVKIQWDDVVYADMRTNWPLANAYQRNAERLGRRFERFEDVPLSRAASSDMGNVSYLVPAIQPMIRMAPKGIVHHHRDFASWAASDDGMRAVTDGAAALAMTAIDFMVDDDLRREVQDAFRATSENLQDVRRGASVENDAARADAAEAAQGDLLEKKADGRTRRHHP
jgi:amidohydrolase